MQKKTTKKSSILLLLSYGPPPSLKFLDNFPNFQLLLSEGVSNFLIKPMTPSLLASILGFSKTFDKNFDFSKEIKPFELKKYEIFKESEEKAQIIEEDTMTEIRYIEKPEVFSQVSNRLKAVVITNDLKNAGFCQKILLDYYFDENLESLNKNSGIFSKLLNEELYELIILDISVENNENQRNVEAVCCVDNFRTFSQ